METAKIRTLHDNDTGDAIAPRTVLSAVTGAQEALDLKADITALADKQDKLEFDQTPTEGSQHPVTSGGVKSAIDAIPKVDISGKADRTYVDDELAKKASTEDLAAKQDKLSGTSGQIVGFDSTGKAVAQAAPAAGITQTAADARYLKLSGGTMTAALAMGSHKITGLATPTATTDAATKQYVDNNAGSNVVVGTYTGNASGTTTTPKAISLGFRPKFVLVGMLGLVTENPWDDSLVQTNVNDFDQHLYSAYAYDGYPYKWEHGNSDSSSYINILEITSSGFSVSNARLSSTSSSSRNRFFAELNGSGSTYFYLAVKP